MRRICSKQSQANSFEVLWNVVEVGSLPPPHSYTGHCPCASVVSVVRTVKSLK